MKQSFADNFLFWAAVGVFLTIAFGYASKDYVYAFYFTAFMFSKEQVKINDHELPISRTYKSKTLEFLTGK